MGALSYAWAESGIEALDRDFLPKNLEPERRTLGSVKTVVVQVLNNLGETDIKNKIISPWKEDIKIAAQNPRIMCKFSGKITEANHHTWKPHDLVPYVHTVLEEFGTDRVMFGSDWPASTLTGAYSEVYSSLVYALKTVQGCMDSKVEQPVFHNNVQSFYDLNA